ncbi:HAD-IIB family hydrolase [Vibrio hippocampi]|nr:HAD-IIB family hydrolase [Vibrio hippocampi]
MPKSLNQLTLAEAKTIEWLFTDVDDTLTWQGAMPHETFTALARLKQIGIKVVAVTGACAGWCDQIAKLWPVHGVIGENGAFWMQKQIDGLKIHSPLPLDTMRAQQQQLKQAVSDILSHYPEITLASDQPFRFSDVAINIGQDRPMLESNIINELLNKIACLKIDGQSVTAMPSSIHINAWVGEHSKRATTQRYLEQHQHSDLSKICYIGDSLNDQTMFEWLPLTVGVNNIRPILNQLTTAPSYITQSNGGFGFAEFADLLIAAKTQA